MVPDPTERELVRRNEGFCFGTRYAEFSAIWEPRFAPLSTHLEAQLEDVFCLDAAIVNGDRKATNPNLLILAETDFVPIDHSLALPVHQGTLEEVLAFKGLTRNNLTDHCAWRALLNRGRRYETLFGTWRARLTRKELVGIRSEIPDSWESKPGDLDKVFAFLEGRPTVMASLTTELREVAR
jgi:hypothetical protein